MSIITVFGHDKIYRDLYIRVDAKTKAMEDACWEPAIEDNDPVPNVVASPAQAKALDALGSGDFEIQIAEDGTLALTLIES